MATVRTVTKATSRKAPAAPQAPRAPQAPAAPPRRAAPQAAPQAAPAAPQAAPAALPRGRFAPAASPSRGTPQAAPPRRAPQAAPQAPQADNSELLARIAAMQATIVELQQSAAKAKALTAKTEQSAADILGDEATQETLHAECAASPGAAWMLDYLGEYPLNLTLIRKGVITYIDASEAKPLMTLCAIPRDSDIGGHGSDARVNGMIAMHTIRNERGNYCRAPHYLTENEFYALLRVTAGEESAADATATNQTAR